MKLFANRRDAGRQLAKLLDDYRERRDVLVVGLARGGLPVAAEVAGALGVPLDVLIVRKLGLPAQPELAMGAVASGGVTVVNEEVARRFCDSRAFAATESRERAEVARRERLYRDMYQAFTVWRRTVILVDDGAATGASMLAAVRAVRKLGSARVIVALPVASANAAQKLLTEADEVLCIGTPLSFSSVGQWYEDFQQTTDAEVAALLATHAEAFGPQYREDAGSASEFERC